MAEARPQDALAALLSAILPVWLLYPALGGFLAPGTDGPALWGELYAGAMVRRWWSFEAEPLQADTLISGAPWWPEAPLTALAQALLPSNPALSLGLIMAVSLWLSAFGPYLLSRRVLGTQGGWGAWLGPVLAGLAVQTGPVVLRGLPTVHFAALGLGALALGLARPQLAWIAGLWSWPNACILLLAGIIGRKPWWLLAGIPSVAVLVAPSDLPGALQHIPLDRASAPAYLGGEGTAFPLPPPEASPLKEAAYHSGLWTMAPMGTLPPRPGLPGGAPAEKEAPERPWIGALAVPLQRLHGGPLAFIGLLAALMDARSRRWGGAGLLFLVGITALYGFQLFPEEERVAPFEVSRLRMLLDGEAIRHLPGRDHGEGALVWAGMVGVCGAVGLAVLWSGRGRVLAPLLIIGPLLENPRLAVPVTPVLPDPMVGLLQGLPTGTVLVWPAPQAPYFQGPRSRERLLWELASAGKSWGDEPLSMAATIDELSERTQLPLDIQAAPVLWQARNIEKPFEAALKGGFNYLLLDFEAVPTERRAELDGWLAAQVGMPLGREGGRLLYDLQSGPAGIASPLDPRH